MLEYSIQYGIVSRDAGSAEFERLRIVAVPNSVKRHGLLLGWALSSVLRLLIVLVTLAAFSLLRMRVLNRRDSCSDLDVARVNAPQSDILQKLQHVAIRNLNRISLRTLEYAAMILGFHRNGHAAGAAIC